MKYNLGMMDINNIGYYSGELKPEFLKSMISKIIRDSDKEIKIYANLQTIISDYINNIKYDERYLNLELLCEKEEIFPMLSEIYNGVYDIKNKTFWFDKRIAIKIVIDNEIENGLTLIVKENNAIGYIMRLN